MVSFRLHKPRAKKDQIKNNEIILRMRVCCVCVLFSSYFICYYFYTISPTENINISFRFHFGSANAVFTHFMFC